MRICTLSADSRLLALRKVHHDLLEQLMQLERLREQLRTAELKEWPAIPRSARACPRRLRRRARISLQWRSLLQYWH